MVHGPVRCQFRSHMTPIPASVIYPELPDPLTPGDLQQLFSPSFDERQWAPTVVRAAESQVALLVQWQRLVLATDGIRCTGRAEGRLVSGFVQSGIAFGPSCRFISLFYRSCRPVDLRSRHSRQWATPPSLSGFSLGADDHADALRRTATLYSAGYAQVCTACAPRHARTSPSTGR